MESRDYSTARRRLDAAPARQEKEVPMDQFRSEVVEGIKENPSAVIIGETGSGKTTRIPMYLLEIFPNAKIAITQPRRVAARSVAGFVAKLCGERVGNKVGFQVRFEDRTTEGTRANFMTDGILLRKLQHDPLLREYDVVMVDEAHERSLNIDFVLGLLKRAQAERKKSGISELKVIVTSATIEKEKFASYFGETPVVEVPGRMHPVDVQYAKEEVTNYPKAAADRVREIVGSSGEGDILIFMPGEAEINKTIKYIKDLILEGLDVIPLYGSLDPNDQDRIFSRSKKRKVIVATNIAETSLTIDGVHFVIDSGLIRQREFKSNTGIEALLTKGHAKSGCDQRKGRAGRTAPGTCYRLYTEQNYQNRDDFQTPEIARSNLDHVILAMKKIGIKDVRSFDFIDKPDEESILKAIETLKILGALDDNESLTEIGRKMAELPLQPEIARMVIESEKYGCTYEVCTIAAMMSGKSLFSRPREKHNEADKAHSRFDKGNSDFMRLLEVWNQWSESGYDYRWASENFLNTRQLDEVRKVRVQLMRDLSKHGIVASRNDVDTVNIQKCIAAGMIQHLVAKGGRYSYRRVDGRESSLSENLFIHPSSVSFRRKPELMIAADVVSTNKAYARLCQPVDPQWLPQIAPQLLEEAGELLRYDQASDSVIREVDYRLRGQDSIITSGELPVTNHEIKKEQFIRALAEGQVDMQVVRDNSNTIQELRALYIRSGGTVTVPELLEWYRTSAGGATSKMEAGYISERLKIKFEDYCSDELKESINELYPESLLINGVRLNVDYEFLPISSSLSNGDAGKEVYKAKITIPERILFTLNVDQIPEIGFNGRPEIVYVCKDMSYTDLEALKVAIDNKRLEEVWRNFTKPEERQIEVTPSQPLPTFESVNAKPIVYAKDYTGNDVFAYPSYKFVRSYEAGKYVNKLYITYVRTEEEAIYNNGISSELKISEDRERNLKNDVETLLEPVKNRYEEMRPIMDAFYDAPYFDQGIFDKWTQVSTRLTSDPREADRLMNEVQEYLDGLKEKQENIDRLLPEVLRRLEELRLKVLPIDFRNYREYGLTERDYNRLKDYLDRATKALATKDDFGRSKLPDPEKAKDLIDEIYELIPEKTEISEVQQELIKILKGKDQRMAQVLRVRNGEVTEYFSPLNPDAINSNTHFIPIGKSNRSLVPEGNRIYFQYASGNRDGFWLLEDGDYLFSRDGDTVLRVQVQKGAPFGLKAIEYVDKASSDTVHGGTAREASNGYYGGTPMGGIVLADLIREHNNGGRRPPGSRQDRPPKPVPVQEVKLVERERMSEELRTTLGEQLDIAHFFLASVRAVPEQDKKNSNAKKISNVRTRALEALRSLNEIRRELPTTDNAERARSKVVEIMKKAEKCAKDISRIQNVREDWPELFKEFLLKAKEIAIENDVYLDEAGLKSMKQKLAELAIQSGVQEDLDSKLEEIIFDSI